MHEKHEGLHLLIVGWSCALWTFEMELVSTRGVWKAVAPLSEGVGPKACRICPISQVGGTEG